MDASFSLALALSPSLSTAHYEEQAEFMSEEDACNTGVWGIIASMVPGSRKENHVEAGRSTLLQVRF